MFAIQLQIHICTEKYIAAEIGRDVLALPGDVNRRSSEGCNMLISCGAHPIVSIPLLWTMFGLRSPQNAKVEDPMLDLFSNGPLSIDEIAELTNSQIEDILSKLTELEGKLLYCLMGVTIKYENLGGEKMPYVNTKEILSDANERRYAVGAFNVNNLEFLQAILLAAEDNRSPVIVATSEGAIKYAGAGPVSLHLDHGRNMEYILAAIKAGYSSVMIDASHLPFEENLRETSKVVEIAHAVGVSVEAELGKLKGIEDNIVERESVLVDPDEAKVFVEKTEVDFLAPAIGTSHGAFKFHGEAVLDLERLEKVKSLTDLPLVSLE